jgi:putative secretion ATPase (PEP-CTERM system associated)
MYESFYNLTEKPFNLSPDPSFYYGSKEHNRVLAYLRYGINQGEGFIVVSGDIGAGKTTLIGALLEELCKTEEIIAAQLVTTQLEPDDLLKMVAGSFGLRYEGLSKSELLKEIEGFLFKQADEGKRVLLIVDEAQNLQHHSLEELRMLSNFQHKKRSLLQSFMLGQAEFRDTLRAPNQEQFRQRIIASYHLGPMEKAETQKYIEHRLKVAGWRGDPRITNEAYAVIYEYSEGIPRRINTLCDRLFLYAFTEEAHEIDDELVRSVVDELDEEIHFSRSENESPAVSTQRSYRVSQVDRSDMSLEERVERLEEIVDNAAALIQSLLK